MGIINCSHQEWRRVARGVAVNYEGYSRSLFSLPFLLSLQGIHTLSPPTSGLSQLLGIINVSQAPTMRARPNGNWL